MPDTQKKLNGKRVMMYCTGGIRCERASALLGEVQAAVPNFETKGIFELRGGIERYMKTFPEGGAWKGKNYVFDRRLVQHRPPIAILHGRVGIRLEQHLCHIGRAVRGRLVDRRAAVAIQAACRSLAVRRMLLAEGACLGLRSHQSARPRVWERCLPKRIALP